MELYINLNELKKSKVREVFGIFLALFSLVVLVTVSFHFRWVQFLQGILFLILGINNWYEGKGKSIVNVAGEKYIKINKERIELKLFLKKEMVPIEWDEVEKVEFHASAISIKLKNGTEHKIEYGEFRYKQVQDIKSIIENILKEKGIA